MYSAPGPTPITAGSGPPSSRRYAAPARRQLTGARSIRRYCRKGIGLAWANTVLRLAVFGQPGEDYPVTFIRDHKDYVIVTDEDTAKQPQIIL